MNIRIASFNFENLFTRAKLLNLASNAQTKGLLNKVEALKGELEKTNYTAAGKAKILSLFKALKAYIDIAETQGKLFTRSGFAVKGVKAKGRDDWSGFIQFKPDKINEPSRANTTRVVKEVNADIVCTVEIESRPALQQFASEHLQKSAAFAPYPHVMAIEGNDPRGIDVGVMSRSPIGLMRSHVDDGEMSAAGKFSRTFSRDCLVVQIEVKKGLVIHLLANHLKSKGYGKPKESDARRKRQAARIVQILKEDFDLARDLVVVAGDFNDTPDSDPLSPIKALMNSGDLFDVLGLQFPNAADRWTYHYKKSEQIDYILISKPLKDAFQSAGVERRGMFDLSKLTKGAQASFNTVTKPTEAASDHCAVWADFSL